MNKVNTLKLNDPLFPPSLRQIDQPPKQLYYIGRSPAEWLDRPKLAIVGTRKVTAYGRHVTQQLASEAASLGVVIISGMALGIDGIAHRAALDSGGTTIAILATGLKRIYPASHLNLAREIQQAGTIMSESADNEPIYKATFLKRNRLISGLADGVLITEAANRSGSLNTARQALEQGKVVMAVPGNITSEASSGANQLIKAGAIPITSTDDILFAMNLSRAEHSQRRLPVSVSLEEELILKLLAEGITDQEEIALKANLSGAELSSLLVGLEIGGHIRPAGAGHWLKS
jgi:DNA processing protein